MILLNKKTQTPPKDGVYIGRGSPLGNPYPIGVVGTRDEVIEMYRLYLLNELELRNPIILLALHKLNADSKLVCFCSPKHCHGEIIDDLWNRYIKNRIPPRTTTYTGIGSRYNTPRAMLHHIHKLAGRLHTLGFTLRSGGTYGADSAFETSPITDEIFLPWAGFNNHTSKFNTPSKEAIIIAEMLYPLSSMGDNTRSLMAVSSHQVLGDDLRSPSDFLVCWTPDGCEDHTTRTEVTGGTGQAISLASFFHIPVFNLKNTDAMERLVQHVKTHPIYPK